MIEVLNQGERAGRKAHQCFHCYRMIPKGEKHLFSTCKYDDIYTLRMHRDCDAAVNALMKNNGISPWAWHEGYPPLYDQMTDGDFEADCAWLRGMFPHVVTRIEFLEQKAAIRVNEWWMPQ